MEHLGANLYTIRAFNGQYVAAEMGGGGAVNANRNSAGPYEEFFMEPLGGGQVAFKTLNGNYLRIALPGGIMDAVATAPGPWETFLLVTP